MFSHLFRYVSLLNDRLPRFIQMFLEIGHERRPACPDGSGIARVGLMLPVNVTVGIADVDVAELREQIDAAAVGGPKIGAAERAIADIAGEHRSAPLVLGLLQSLDECPVARRHVVAHLLQVYG